MSSQFDVMKNDEITRLDIYCYTYAQCFAYADNKNISLYFPDPPQIYPWMKRVHLGQSEYSLIF